MILLKATSALWGRNESIWLEVGTQLDFVTALGEDPQDVWMVRTGKHAGKQVVIWRPA